MNRVFLFLLLSVFVFAACEGPEGPRGPQGIPGEDGQTFETEVHDITILPADWDLVYDKDGLNPFYYCVKELSWLTQYKYEKALISVSKYLDRNNKNAGYIPLPESFPMEWESVQGDEYIVWTEHYSYICLPKAIEFNVAYSDFQGVEDGDLFPGTQVFRVVLAY